VLEQVNQGAIEWKGWQIPLSQLVHRDLVDETRVRVLLRISIVEAIDILDQGDRGATEALWQALGTSIGAVRGDPAHARRMLP
jgi:hypothetical protein